MPSTKHLVDPDLLPILDSLPDPTIYCAQRLNEAREAAAAMIAALICSDDYEVRSEERRIATATGHEVRVIVHLPNKAAAARPALLHIHAGGYIVGTAEMSTGVNRALVDALDCVIVSVDYRLAPETPHPGPVEDCYAALNWLHDNAASLGVDPARIGLVGESAGGGLAAALALLARDRGEIPVVHQHLLYPMLDDRTCLVELPLAGEFVWSASANHYGWSALLGKPPGSEGVSPYAAAARSADLSGLPSTFILCGALDLFLREDIEYARRLIEAGVPTELHVYPGAFHAFDRIPGAKVSDAANRASLEALRRVMSAPG